MSKNKVLKRTVIVIISATVLVLVAWQLLKEFKIKAYLVETIHVELNHYFEDSVQLEIEDVSFLFLAKKIVLEEVRLNLVAKEKDTLASLALPNLTISWDDYWESFNSELFKFNSLELKNARLLLPLNFDKIKTKKASRPSFDGRFELKIKNFIVEKGEILFYDMLNEKSGRVKSDYILIADNVHFQKGEIPEKFQDVLEDIFLEFHDLTYFLKDDLHKVDIKKLSFDLFKRDITLIGTHFYPLHSPNQFAKLKGIQANHIDILLDSIQLNTISWQGDSIVSILSIFTNNVALKVSKDKNYPLPDDKFVPILVDQLKSSSISIDIRKCEVQNMNLVYSEIPNGGQEKGEVSISNIQGDIRNITNRQDSIMKYGTDLVIKASGNLYDEGKLTADIRYNLNSKYGYFTVAGNLEPMAISPINNYMSKSYPVAITSGQLDELYFNYSGGSKAVRGEMEFKYSDLKIQFHKVLNEEEKGDKALSWLANVALSQENPRKNGRFRVGRIEFKRDTRKSMFSYWSNSLLSGFQSTIGLKKASRIEKLDKEEMNKSFWRKVGIGKEEESE